MGDPPGVRTVDVCLEPVRPDSHVRRPVGGRLPFATGGLVAGAGQIWTCDRQLVALGGSTLRCRPAGRRPDR